MKEERREMETSPPNKEHSAADVNEADTSTSRGDCEPASQTGSEQDEKVD